jgi:hypothetical protein
MSQARVPTQANSSSPTPPQRWRLILLPACMAILGMLVAWAAATTGQDARRHRDELQLTFDRYYWMWELDQAKLAGKPAAEITKIQKIVDQKMAAGVISYARYGRQFTSWDGYRYEEIIDEGYVYHQPFQAEADRKNPQPMIDVGGPERRSKNVVWYPLYPLLASGLMTYVPISSTLALTVVSWTCCLLGSIVTFLYARRYYFFRAERMRLPGDSVWPNLTAHDSAAIWAVAVLLFGPCSIFLYANFTESLFVLLLALFLYCLQERWWWRAAIVAGFASATRSQGVLFGPILGLTFLLRGTPRPFLKRVALTPILGLVSGLGLACYMLFLYQEFGDPLAFMHAQRYWNVGISLDRIRYALDPTNAMTHVLGFILVKGEIDWPRLWEGLCLIWPPIVLLVWGWRYLSFELLVVAWMLWGLPYVSNSMAGNPPFDTQWMSMGRFMGVALPIFMILGAMFERRRWLGLLFMVPWTVAFGVFAYKYGSGAWVG